MENKKSDILSRINLQKRKECPHCHSCLTIRKGKRKKKMQSLQIYQCKNCKKIFTTQLAPNITYPLRVILTSISFYNLGYTQSQVTKIMARRYKIRIPQRTLSAWIKKFSGICTFSRLRNEAKTLHEPEDMIFSKRFYHQQVYNFQFHKAKLNLFCNKDFCKREFCKRDYEKEEEKAEEKEERFLKIKERIRDYLLRVSTKEFPSYIFHTNNEIDKTTKEKRASQINMSTLRIKKFEKYNYANVLARLALQLARNNKERHERIQDFMLKNDSTTIAVEVPVYLTNDDIDYFKKRDFKLNFENYTTPITGHIDLLQIRNNLIHILDYKPDADKVNAVKQLTIYALALASRTKLAVKDFKCAWFDHENYFEFFPLHVVYKLKKDKERQKQKSQ